MDSHARRKIKRKKRPSCPTCKSRRWRRDDEGFLVCPYGHQMRGYVQEEQDEEAGIANNSRKQSIRKKRRRHTQSLHARAGLIPLTVLCEMFQMSLRLQVEGLAKNAGFGSELEKMVLHLWMSYIHSHGFTHDLNDRIVKDSGWRSGAESDMDAYSSGYESTNTMASDHPTYANTVRKRVMRKAQTSRKGELSVSATGGGPQGYTQENWSAGGEMSDGWLTTAGESSMGGTEDEMSLGEKSSGWVTSAGQEEESAEDLSADGVDGDQDIKNEIERGSNLRFIEPIYTLGFIYLACRCLHLPVLMADIQNMALSGVIPYLTLYKQVHQNFPGKQYEPVEQKSPPRRKHLLQAIWAILARLKSFTQSEPFPFLNLPPLWIRALGAAGLDPEVFYPDVAALWRITQVGVQQDKKRKNPATISYKEEAEAISVVLIAFKLRVGATGYGSDPEVTRWTDYYVSRRPVAVKKQFAVWNSVDVLYADRKELGEYVTYAKEYITQRAQDPDGLNIFTSNCKPETGMDILDDDSDSDSDSHKDEDEVAKPVEKEIEAAMTDTSVGVEDEWSVHPALAAIPVDGSSDEEEREATEEVEDTREGDVVSGDTSDPHDGDEQSKVNMDVDRHSHSLNSDTPDLEDDHDDAQPRLSASPPSPSSSPAPSDPPPFPSNPHYLSYIAPDPQGIYPLPYALILTSLSQFLGVDSQVVERCVQDTERKLRGEAGWVQAAVKSIKRE